MTVLPLGMNMSLYTSSAVLACGVPPSTATGRHRNVSEATALTYSSLSMSSKVGRRSLPTTLSSSSWARGMKLWPNLTHAKKKLASVPAVYSQDVVRILPNVLIQGIIHGLRTVSMPAPNGEPAVYASSRSDMPKAACSSRRCVAKQGVAAPLATLSLMSFKRSIYSCMSFWRCLRTSAFQGASMAGTYLSAGYLSAAYFPGMLRI